MTETLSKAWFDSHVVSHCGNNSWCCRNDEAQDCCKASTNVTSLQPWPVSNILRIGTPDESTISAFQLPFASASMNNSHPMSQEYTSASATMTNSHSASQEYTKTNITSSTRAPTAMSSTIAVSTNVSQISTTQTQITLTSSPSAPPSIPPAVISKHFSYQLGIKVGVPVGIASLLTVVIITHVFLKKKRERDNSLSRQKKSNKEINRNNHEPESPHRRHMYGFPPRELEGHHIRELDGQMVRELDGTIFYELPASEIVARRSSQADDGAAAGVNGITQQIQP